MDKVASEPAHCNNTEFNPDYRPYSPPPEPEPVYTEVKNSTEFAVLFNLTTSTSYGGVILSFWTSLTTHPDLWIDNFKPRIPWWFFIAFLVGILSLLFCCIMCGDCTDDNRQ